MKQSFSTVSSSASCGDTCQMWMGFKESNKYFCKIEKFAYGAINEWNFNDPTPGNKATSWYRRVLGIVLTSWPCRSLRYATRVNCYRLPGLSMNLIDRTFAVKSQVLCGPYKCILATQLNSNNSLGKHAECSNQPQQNIVCVGSIKLCLVYISLTPRTWVVHVPASKK